MQMANVDIRTKATLNGVRLWQIAEVLNISESYFCRKLRHELPEEEKEKVNNAIDQIARGN